MEIQKIKNTYAQEQGYEDWEALIYSVIHSGINGRYAAIIAVEKHMDEICIRAQKAALEKAAESARVQMDLQTDWYGIDRASITNEENLIR